MAQPKRVTRAMRFGNNKPTETSKYAKKCIRRARAARIAGLPANTPWPAIGMGERTAC